jgi:hypothetical protein
MFVCRFKSNGHHGDNLLTKFSKKQQTKFSAKPKVSANLRTVSANPRTVSAEQFQQNSFSKGTGRAGVRLRVLV